VLKSLKLTVCTLESAMTTAMTTLRAALIDLDGTLADTIADLAHAANAMRVELGLTALPQALVATFVGKGTDMLIARMLTTTMITDSNALQTIRQVDPALFTRAREIFHRHYHEVNGRYSTLYPGVLDGLQALRDQGLRLAIVTNKASEFTLPLIAHLDLADHFDVVVCGDTCARRKPDPDPVCYACQQLNVSPAQSVLIGDSVNDVQAARAAGCRALAVPYGYNEGQPVAALNADAIVPTLIDAAAWVASH